MIKHRIKSHNLSMNMIFQVEHISIIICFSICDTSLVLSTWYWIDTNIFNISHPFYTDSF